MSFLIFAYRKLALKRQISQKEFRQLQISQQKQTLTDQIGQLQQAISAGKSIFTNMASSAMYTAQNDILSKYKDGAVPQDQQASIQQQLYSKQYEISQRTNMSNSIFEAASNVTMTQLKNQESIIDTENASLESQLKLLRPELESVEKGETEAAKSEAPKFGLG